MTRTRPRWRPAALQAGRQAPPEWYRVGPVLALAGDDDQAGEDNGQPAASTADVYVFDTIGGWFGMTADDFVRDVAGLDVDRIVVHLNSPGGDAMEGVAIANVLRAHRAHIVVRVDGMAASAASVIAMAGTEVVMGIGSQLMIHDAWGYAMGNAADMEQAARMLDSTSDSYASAYAARAGGTAAEWREAMRAESWYTGEEAVTAGLADRVAAADETGTAEGEQITPGRSAGGWWDLWDSLRTPERHDLSAYRYGGRAHAPAPVMPGRTTAAASAAGRTTNRRGLMAFTDEQLRRIRAAHGLDDDADEAAITEAVTGGDRHDEDSGDNGGAEHGSDPVDQDDDEHDTEDGDPTDDGDGTVTIDARQYRALRADAQAGRAAHTRQQREDRERLVDAAVGDGRIAKASRAHWLRQLETSGPGAVAALVGLAKGLIPVDGERGYAGGGDSPPATAATVRESAAYQAWRF